MQDKVNELFVKVATGTGAVLIAVVAALLIIKLLAKTGFLMAVVTIALVVSLLPVSYWLVDKAYNKK